RARFRDDAFLAHALREQDLAEGVVDLVRAGVEQVLALEVNFRPAEFAREPLRKVERRRPPGILLEKPREMLLKIRILARGEVFGSQVVERGHQRLGNEHAAIRAKVAMDVRERGEVGHRSAQNRREAAASQRVSEHQWSAVGWIAGYAPL